MSLSSLHRLLHQIARNAAWGSSAWLAVMVGCVEAPQSFTPVDSTEAQAEENSPPAELAESLPTVAAPVATPQPQLTLGSEDASAVSLPSLLPVPEPEASEPAPVAQSPLNEAPTPNELVPEPNPPTEATAPNQFPGELSSTISADESETGVPAPFPATAEPTSQQVAPAPSVSPPAAVAQAGQPVVNANANPLDATTKPRSVIHISPKSRMPLDAAAKTDPVDQNPANQNVTSQPPAVTLPPAPEADAASLAPLPTTLPATSPLVVEDTPPQTALNEPQPSTVEKSPAAEKSPADLPISNSIPTSPTSIGQTESAPPLVAETPEGFTPLFNNQDLTGWEVIDGKPAAWQFKDGKVSCVTPGGGWLQTLAMYSDFELRFEYRLSEGGNSGVSLRYPGHGNPSLQGLEIQLLDDRAEKYRDILPQQATGSLYFAAAPQVRDASHPAGTWNHCAVRCVGHQLEVSINNKLVNEIDLSQLSTKAQGASEMVSAVRSPMGSIALQSHSTRVDFRQVMIQDLTQSLASGVRWLDLQQGTGDPVPSGARVTVHYIGHLSTGKRFANSVEKAKPVTILLKDVIPGWREGIPGMRIGGKRRLVVPPEMAYGEKGFKEVVPPNSTLVYEIELLEFEQPADALEKTAEVAPASVEVETK